MDSTKLKEILKAQKTALDEAVKAKIAYLKSDKVFDLEGPYAKSFSLNLKKENTSGSSIEEAFGLVSNQKAPQSFAHTFSPATQETKTESENKKPMSMAERINALRGAVGTPSSCMGYQRK